MTSITSLPQNIIQLIEECAKIPNTFLSKEKIKDICQNIAYEQSNVCILKLIFDNKNFYPLHDENEYLRKCSAKGFTELVSILLKNKTTLFEFGNLGNLAVSDAMQGKHTDTLKILLKDERTVMKGKCNNIHIAAEKGLTEIVKLLLENPNVNPDLADNVAIRRAAANNHIEVVKLLLPKIDIKSIDQLNFTDTLIRVLHQELTRNNMKNLLDQLTEEIKKRKITKIKIDKDMKVSIEKIKDLNKDKNPNKGNMNEILKQLINDMKNENIAKISISIIGDKPCIKQTTF